MTDLDGMGEVPTKGDKAAPKEERALSDQRELFAKWQVRIVRQNWYLRLMAFIVALAVIVGAVYLEWQIIKYLIVTKPKLGDLFFVLAVSPIAAVTSIVIFLLIGVFRGFRERDLSALPLQTASKETFGNGS